MVENLTYLNFDQEGTKVGGKGSIFLKRLAQSKEAKHFA